jgi:hypothetical protein
MIAISNQSRKVCSDDIMSLGKKEIKLNTLMANIKYIERKLNLLSIPNEKRKPGADIGISTQK